jgi:plastocyanin
MNNFQKFFFLLITTVMISTLLIFYLSNTLAIGEGEELLEIPAAESVYNKEFMSLPQNTGSFIILIPNEAHESWHDEKHKLLTDKNPYYIPTNLIIPKGTTISFLNADAPWDTPHPHTINVKDSSGNVVYSTGKMEYGDSSDSKILPVGNYSIVDSRYHWMKGSITVKDQNSTGTSVVVGGFYTPTEQVEDKRDNDGKMHPGSLNYYRTQFSKNGLKILSEYDFNYTACDYCKGKYWPDNKTDKHTLIIFSTDKPLAQALNTLEKLVKDNVYV